MRGLRQPGVLKEHTMIRIGAGRERFPVPRFSGGAGGETLTLGTTSAAAGGLDMERHRI